MRLPPVNTTRANGGTRGGNGVVAIPVGGTCRIAAKRLTLTGGAHRVSVGLPDRGYVATPGPLPPVNAAWANGGTWGREWAAMLGDTCRINPRLLFTVMCFNGAATFQSRKGRHRTRTHSLYADVIVQRFEKFTGKKAERIAAPTEQAV